MDFFDTLKGLKTLVLTKLKFIFAPPSGIMVGIAQLVRALVCGTRGRGFKSHYPPKENRKVLRKQGLFCCA